MCQMRHAPALALIFIYLLVSAQSLLYFIGFILFQEHSESYSRHFKDLYVIKIGYRGLKSLFHTIRDDVIVVSSDRILLYSIWTGRSLKDYYLHPNRENVEVGHIEAGHHVVQVRLGQNADHGESRLQNICLSW